MKTSVLIVGAGPVGLTLASELARYGVLVRIIDKAPARTGKSKALVVWSRTLELLERAGCNQALVRSGFKIDTVSISTAEATVATDHVRLAPMESSKHSRPCGCQGVSPQWCFRNHPRVWAFTATDHV